MKKLLILTILSSLLLTSCSEEKKEITKKYYKTQTVQTGSVLVSDNFVWYTDSFHTIALAPKVGGKIVSINKNVWDKVKIWEIVATLDSTEAKTWYSSSLDIISSLESLKKSTSEMFESQIQVMQEKISQANTAIEMADISIDWANSWIKDTQNTIESGLKTIDTQIENLETQIENTTNSLNNKENDIYNNSKNAISNANIFASNLVDFLDNLFWVTDWNKYKNDAFEIYLWAKNSSLTNQMDNDILSLINKLKQAKSLPTDSKDDLKWTLEFYNWLFWNDIRNILKNTYTILENSVESESFSISTISSYKSQITSFQNQNEQIILSVSGNYFLWIKWSLDSINSFQKEKKTTLDMLEKQLQTLKQSKVQASSAGSWQMTDMNTKTQIAKKQKEIAIKSLNEALAWLEALKKQKQASLSEIDAQIAQVKSGKNESGVMIENGKVISLTDWIITKKLQEVWNIINAWMPILMVSNNENIKIEVWVPDEILEKLTIWQEVKVEVSWVSKIISGTISNIFPSKDNITKKTTIEIKINNPEVKIWSYSKVYFDIPKDENENNIIIPNSAIISKYMIPQVFVLENWVSKLRNIEIQKQNDNFSQVTWLKVWEIIITDGKENIFDGEIFTK